MPITFFCSSCGRQLKARDEGAGKTGNCPDCKTPFTIPAAAIPSPLPSPVPSPILDEEQPPALQMSGEQVRRTIAKHWQWIGLGIACFVMVIGAWIWLPDVVRKIILERFPVMSILGFLATITFVLIILWRKNQRAFWIVLAILGALVFWPTIKRYIWPPAPNATNVPNDTHVRKPARSWIGFVFWGVTLVGYLHSKGYLDDLLTYITPLIETVKSFFQS